MKDRELPDEVRRLIHSSVPNVDALETLICLVRSAPGAMTAEDLSVALRPAVVPTATIVTFLRFFLSQGLGSEDQPGSYCYRAGSPELDRAVQGLVKAYDERPVTLIRTVYDLADQQRIQAFSEAFRLKKDG